MDSVEPASSSARAAESRPRVLLLEDDPDFSQLLSGYLTTCGYNVTAFEDGLSGLECLRKMDFDAIVCDMMMPTLTGDAVFHALQTERPHLCPRFILMTGHVTNPRVDVFLRETHATLLAKPFRMSLLHAKVETILRARIPELRRVAV